MVQVFEAIVHIIVQVIERFTAGILHHFHAEVSSPSDDPNDEWLECFTEDDGIFSEWTTPSRRGYMHIIEEHHEIQIGVESTVDWRNFRPPFRQTSKKAFITALGICAGGIFLGLTCILVTYTDLQTLDFCELAVNEIPSPWKVMVFICEMIACFLFHIWYPTVLVFTFSLATVKASRVFDICIFALVLDMCYRILFFATGMGSRSANLLVPLMVLVCISMVIQAFRLSGFLIERQCREYTVVFHKRLHLTVKLISPFVSSWIIAFILVWLVYPWFKSQEYLTRMAIATFAPLLGSVTKTFNRVLVQRLWYLNHPGKSFGLLSCLYGCTTVFFRVMQADFSYLETVALLSVISGIAEVLERSTIAIRDHLDNQVCERRIVRMGEFRTPRSERLTADVVVMSMLNEMTGVLTVNGCILAYKLLYTTLPIVDSLQRFLKFVSVQCGIEGFFIAVSLLMSSHLQNMAVLSVWRKHWRRHCFITAFTFTVGMIYGGGFIMSVVQDSDFVSFNCTVPFNRQVP